MRDLIGRYINSIDKLRLDKRTLYYNTLILGEEGSGKTNLACKIRNYVIDNEIPTLYLDFANSNEEEVELRYKDKYFNYIRFDESDKFLEEFTQLVSEKKNIYMAVNPNFFSTQKDVRSKLTDILQTPELLEHYYYFFHDIANLNGFYAKFEDFLLYMFGFLNLKKHGMTFLSQPNEIFENPKLKLLFTFLFVGKCSNADYFNTAILKTLRKNKFLYQNRPGIRTLILNDIETNMVEIDEYIYEEE